MVSPSLPDANGSGLQQRAFYLLRDLTRNYRVTLLLVGQGFPTPSDEVAQMAERIELLPAQPLATWKRRVALLFPPLVQLVPAWAADWSQLRRGSSFTLPDGIDCVFFRMRTDAVQAVLVHGKGAKRYTMMDIDDVESATLRSIGLRALREGKLWLGIQSLAMAWQYLTLERTILRKYSEVCYASEADERLLARFCGADQLTYRPNRVRLRISRKRPDAASIFTLLFLGTLNYFPNVDAVLWILSEILPQLRLCLVRPFRVVVAGRDAEPSLVGKLIREPEVEYRGKVDEVDSLYAQAHLALAAVRCGGGTKIKVLEAAAVGCPVVSTTHSCLGLPFEDGNHVLIGDDARRIAHCCARLQLQPQFAQEMAAAAYATLSGSSFDAGAVELNSARAPSFSR